MRGMLAYEGVAHLEDPVTLDDIDRAKGVAFGTGPGQLLLLNVGPVLITRIQALGAALILARFRWCAAAAEMRIGHMPPGLPGSRQLVGWPVPALCRVMPVVRQNSAQ